MLAMNLWTILLLFMAPCIFATNCLIKISVEPEIIKEMISTQGFLCSIPVKVLHKEKVTDVCDLWALIYEIDGLLEKLTFISESPYDLKKNHLINAYKACLMEEDIQDAVSAYLQTKYMTPVEILQRVNDSLHKLNGFEADSGSSSECESYYKKNGQNNNDVTKGPQCACPSSATPISSTATSQTSLSYLSEFVGSTYRTIYSSFTSPLAEDMSGTYPEKLISPPKNFQSLDSSQFIFTDIPSDDALLTTIVGQSHADTTVQSGDYTDFPMFSTEFPNGIHEPSYTSIVGHSHADTTVQSGDFTDFPMHSTETTNVIHEASHISISLNSSQTDPEQVNTDTANSYTEGMYESVVPPTVEHPSLPAYSPINIELSTIMEPDEIQETTKSEFGKESSKGSVFENSPSVPSMKLGIETSSISVTKVRRSLVNVEAVSKAAALTQAVSSLSTSINDPNLLFLKSVHTNFPSSERGLSNTEAASPVSQGNAVGDRNLAWASSYLSSTMLTTKAELSMSDPGGQLPLSDASHNPVLNADKSDNILPQQERYIAIGDRQNSFSGPNYFSNLLPIIATERSKKGLEEQNQSNVQLIIIVILVVLVLLFLCGFLYYRHQYRVLKRRLNIGCDQALTINADALSPEERDPLQIIECDLV